MARVNWFWVDESASKKSGPVPGKNRCNSENAKWKNEAGSEMGLSQSFSADHFGVL
jgi:hypothetical protein